MVKTTVKAMMSIPPSFSTGNVFILQAIEAIWHFPNLGVNISSTPPDTLNAEIPVLTDLFFIKRFAMFKAVITADTIQAIIVLRSQGISIIP
nr:hypothetical protein [uncultured Ruminococcus sp.]